MQPVFEFISTHSATIYMVLLAVFLGFEVISNVPTVLHTPLMSGANAISGIVVVGAILLVRQSAADDYFSLFLGSLGILLGTINIVGGHAVTHRMLSMFRQK